MMRVGSLALALMFPLCATSFGQWKPSGDNLKTPWGEKLDSGAVWREYPRPNMERPEWSNLNGFWDYAIRPKGEAAPESFDGKILVPFCVESSLSGVQKSLRENQELWYRRTFTVPEAWSGRKVQLNFEAVDWKADVYLNGSLVGSHTGGYTPFSFDITPHLQGKGEQKLVVKVWDPTNGSFQPIGKQRHDPTLIWYTPVSGIWQTVWLEPVAERHIESVTTTADIDRGTLTVKTKVADAPEGWVEATLKDGDEVVSRMRGAAGNDITLLVLSPKLWDPKTPFLYDLVVTLRGYGPEGKVDEVKSYAAMRKISTREDKDGFVRIQLNNRDIFPLGPLDQGWWPDGLYTPPSDEAMRYDIVKTKEWGYNMIRKHIKVEPARWYTECDRMGMLVWQDMPSGDGYPKWEAFKYNGGEEVRRTPESAANYRKEWREIMDHLMPYPCISVWVPFNESWGQFDTIGIAEWMKRYDPTRLVNPASGGNHRPCGDILDIHHYPDPEMPLNDPERANVLGEFGGILLTLEDHLWKADPKHYWDNRKIKTKEDATRTYVKYLDKLGKLIPKGLAGAVYTRTTDVEVEVNGLMTYDRKVIKLDEARVRQANEKITRSLGN